MTPSTALVFCGGGPATAPVPPLDDPLVVAADAGVIEAHRQGFDVDLLIGDLDSAPPTSVARVTRSGGRLQRHSPDKDATDLELALDAAEREGVERVLVVGGHAGRLDHLIGNALLLAAPRFAALAIDAVFGEARLHVVRDHRVVEDEPGNLISLFALGGTARGVRSSGLRWNLDGDDLDPGSTRGISNVFVEPIASLAVESGVLLAIRPSPDDAEAAR
ncbi:MAG: thiamine diphosphokinase [Actinobacteria bacterium]|nr:thiamine diphosphokinase [Actinomycetota bacterium]